MLDLYSYTPVYELTFYDNSSHGYIFTNHRNEMLKLHKGLDNRVCFSIKNRDFKKLDVENTVFKAKIYNPLNNETVLTKYLDSSNCNKGEVCLIVTDIDLLNITEGYYKMVILRETYPVASNIDYYINEPVYTNHNSDIDIDVYVTNKANAHPYPTTEILPEDWLQKINIVNNESFYVSKAVKCNKSKDVLSSLHTFSVYATNLTAKLQLYGTLEISPPPNIRDYFILDIIPGITEIVFNDFTGIDVFNIATNVSWVKFKLVYYPVMPQGNGSLDKILFR